MKYLVSIIMPHYNESIGILVRSLNSISTQLGIDHNSIELIIINDCNVDNIPKKRDIGGYDYKIRMYMSKVNGGPSIIRQIGTWMSNGEYIMYLDADNVLHNVYSLRDMIMKIRSCEIDMVEGNLIEQNNDSDGNVLWISNKGSSNDVACKIVRLSKMNLRFDRELRIHEDNLMSKMMKSSMKYEHVDTMFCVYYHRMNSTTTVESSVEAFNLLIDVSMKHYKYISTISKEDPMDVMRKLSVEIVSNLFTFYYLSLRIEEREWREYIIEYILMTFSKMSKDYPNMLLYNDVESTKLAISSRNAMGNDVVETFLPSTLYKMFMEYHKHSKSQVIPPKDTSRYVNNSKVISYYDKLWNMSDIQARNKVYGYVNHIYTIGGD